MYGIDVDRVQDLAARSWRSLRNRIHQLTTNPATRAYAWVIQQQEGA